MSPKTAIIIPAYNEATVLDATIRELRKLKLDLDLVVINDGSTDNTAKVTTRSLPSMLTDSTILRI